MKFRYFSFTPFKLFVERLKQQKQQQQTNKETKLNHQLQLLVSEMLSASSYARWRKLNLTESAFFVLCKNGLFTVLFCKKKKL